MSFLLPCPNCGSRSAYEFHFAGEYHRRPEPAAPATEWTRYLYLRENAAGNQLEWWYHRMGCRLWFLVVRNTLTNQIQASFRPKELEAYQAGQKSPLGQHSD